MFCVSYPVTLCDMNSNRFLIFFIFLFGCQHTIDSNTQKESPSVQEKDSLKNLIDTLSTVSPSPPVIFHQSDTFEVTSFTWQKIDTGLSYTEVIAPLKTNIDDNKIQLLKIDPTYYDFHLESCKEDKSDPKTAPQWAKEKGFIAVFNAGMYQMDYATNTGHMKDYGFINNPQFNKDKSVLVFNPSKKNLPNVQIIDSDCQQRSKILPHYASATQSIRMLSCQQQNVWSQQKRYWSMVVVGVDKYGHVLFCFTRSPHSVHDFVEMLVKIDIDIHQLMYLEGGSEASFVIRHPNLTVSNMGSFETDFMPDNSNLRFWKIPNIIGITKKK